MNRLVLSACIVESSPLRYTPAGVPALDLKLAHESETEEAGGVRQIKATLKAVALGPIAEQIVRQTVGTQAKFTGFIGTPRSGKGLVFHIQEFNF